MGEITSKKPRWDVVSSHSQEHCYNVRIFSARHDIQFNLIHLFLGTEGCFECFSHESS